MSINWPEQSDDDLLKLAQSGQETFQVANIEAMRGLRNSIDALRQSTDTYSRWLVWATIVLAVFTAILTYKALRP